MHTALRALLWIALIALLHTAAHGATLPAGFTETQVSGLSRPTAMALAPDGRIFVCEQDGRLRVIKNGVLLATPFLTVTVDTNEERGLVGVALGPDFAVNKYIYIYHTTFTTTAVFNRVSRFTADGDMALPGSEVVILDLNNLNNRGIHNGGAMHFGPEGKLYIAVGDNAVPANAQTLDNLLGKILRINPDGSIPSDNPFFNSATGKNRAIWALGLRNPFTFAFQPGTNRMFINDVGEAAWEEINDAVAGSNYGWSVCEGFCSIPQPGFRDPLFAYAHGSGQTMGCAITGGTFYNPQSAQFPGEYRGKYFFSDFCSGWIRLFDPSNNTATDFAAGISNPVDLRVSADGSLYYLARGSGSVFRVQYPAGIIPPSITANPTDQKVAEGETATFSITAQGPAPLSYQWQKNGVDIPGANLSSYTTPPVATADEGARFRCRVSNNFGSVTSSNATLTLLPNTVQFSQSSYGLMEGSGFLGVTVTRTGNTSQPASVNYASSDTSGLANCNPAFSGLTGLASSRCDYATAVGTLRFAPGETSKTIPLIVVDDVHVEGPELFTLALSNPTGGAVLGTPASATVTITDNGNDAAGAANPIDGTNFFVTQHYMDFLNRLPEPAGFANWTSTINNCPQGNTSCDRLAVSSGIYLSPEFRDRGYFVYKVYAASLGRFPRYAEFMPDLARVSGFQTTQELEQSKLDFIQEFMSRQEFRSAYDSFGSGQPFVDAILQRAGVTISNRVEIINRLGAGQMTRGQAVKEIVESAEVDARFFNEATIVMHYFGYLRRDPDALYQHWVDVLQQSGNFRTITNGFANSTEYRFRFGSQ